MMQEEANSQSSTTQRPWWFHWLQKGACVLAAIICVALGLFECITLNSKCLLAGVVQIIVGILVFLLEAPCCCAYLDFIDAISKFSDARPAYQKALLYCLLPIAPMAICPGPSSVVGCVLIIVCGLSFAFVALGRKATREEMLAVAREDSLQSKNTSGLVDNAQPISQTAPPRSSNIV